MIVNALTDSKIIVSLSLDGGGVYRKVTMDRQPPAPAPFNGSTLAGAAFMLDLQTTELIDELPSMADGAW